MNTIKLSQLEDPNFELPIEFKFDDWKEARNFAFEFATEVRDEIDSTSRWSSTHDLEIEYKGKIYYTYYTKGLTEMQDHAPFENDPCEFTLLDKVGVYKVEIDCGRNGDLSGIFLAKASEVESIIGEEIYLGEVLGKHSDIVWYIEQKDVRLVSDDPNVVDVISKNNLTSGINPFDYEIGE